ncbi:MAG TPA: hypothetical protein DHU69_02215 [Deltaproteobacteria bacterium]|nr:MAG: hypothetical protein A2056_03510 [Deltaproteobacteria bacterium GWA2_42_85]OGP39573.1 MAG: hypothetical protein A2090_06985 [Deltaproteobacteria bacterium GWD2_42_10]OGP46073.1 MAG: hypothetical protein A2022_04340 [Deltaproteobacteria bacterium GWF2_42_12]OGQ30062.1 MAG: hypothetical protein A3D29_05005 [Deltaproteobacteria bacterium RIFCSPHIGHO2_02_FULL_42_44]OGQ37271.1 MAG: hypothetical protein A3H47_07435 [Deltaproteobacteria bacterium RIFCSPLOWO2_02_FULL_42_39]OGQ69805.1 MAG: hypo
MGIKEDLDILDVKITKLRVDYEQYFTKTLKREPTFLRDEVDRLILKYSNQPITNTALKFRYSTLASKYTSCKQFWNRILRQIEEGTYERGAGVGVRAPEIPRVVEPLEQEPASDSKFKGVYQQYLEARKQAKEQTKGMNYEEFTSGIMQQTEKLKKDLKCTDVEYKVTVKDGKAKVTLIPKK